MLHILYNLTDEVDRMRVKELEDLAYSTGIIAVPFLIDTPIKMESHNASPNMKYVLPQDELNVDELHNVIIGRFMVTQVLVQSHQKLAIHGYTLVIGESKLARSVAASIMTTENPVLLLSQYVSLDQGVDLSNFASIVIVDHVDQLIEIKANIPVINYARVPILKGPETQVISGREIDEIVNYTVLCQVLDAGGVDFGVIDEEVEAEHEEV